MSFRNRYWDTATNNLSAVTRGHSIQISKSELFEKWIVNSNIDFSQNWNVLDIGTGMGRWSLWLAPKVKKMVCMDFSAEMLKFIRANSIRKNINNILLVKSDINEWEPEKGQYYDLIIISGVLELINDSECEALLNKIGNSVIKNGKIIFRDHIVRKNITKSNFVFFRNKKFYMDLFTGSGFRLLKEFFTLNILSELIFKKPVTKIFIWEKT